VIVGGHAHSPHSIFEPGTASDSQHSPTLFFDGDRWTRSSSSHYYLITNSAIFRSLNYRAPHANRTPRLNRSIIHLIFNHQPSRAPRALALYSAFHHSHRDFDEISMGSVPGATTLTFRLHEDPGDRMQDGYTWVCSLTLHARCAQYFIVFAAENFYCLRRDAVFPSPASFDSHSA
jgi:hypothetical protein